jgi:transposase-like protein
MKRLGRLSVDQKLALLRRIEAGERVAEVAKSAGVLRKSLYEWRDAFRAFGAAGLNRERGPNRVRALDGPAAAASGPPNARTRFGPPTDNLAKAKKRIAEFERLAGRQQADLDFFREALRSWDEKRHASGAPISSRSSKK